IECTYYGTDCTFHPTVGADNGGDCILAGFICSGYAATPGSGSLITADLSGDNVFVDNFFNSYMVLAEPHDLAGETKLGGLIVGYVLRVSPAPATATFADVPTNDIYFQFIEAIAASGITVGCDNVPNYCPDRPITRAEMAVFPAKAPRPQFPSEPLRPPPAPFPQRAPLGERHQEERARPRQREQQQRERARETRDREAPAKRLRSEPELDAVVPDAHRHGVDGQVRGQEGRRLSVEDRLPARIAR